MAHASDPADLVQLPDSVYPGVNTELIPTRLRHVPENDVTVFVDPLDATREYTRGVYEAVTVLIGICVGEIEIEM